METSSDEEYRNDDPSEEFPAIRSISKEDLLSSLDEFETQPGVRSRSDSAVENFQKILDYEETLHKTSNIAQRMREQMSSPEIASPDKRKHRLSQMLEFVQEHNR